MKKLLCRAAGVWITVLFFTAAAGAAEKGRVVTPGDYFPEFSFPLTFAKSDVEYLGLPTKFMGLVKGDSFSLKDVKAELIVVEYLNKYCFSCQLQAPLMNQLFETIVRDAQLRDQVKFLGVGAGNNQKEVDSFRADKKIPFPLVPDAKFLAYEAIGDPGATPFTLLLRKADSGLVVTWSKMGYDKDANLYLKAMNASLGPDWTKLLKQKRGPSIQEAKARRLSIPFTEAELLKKAQESMAGPKWKVLGAAKVKLENGEEIYVGEIQTGSQKSHIFAKLASRAPTCDLCHATHFFFTFDGNGMILNFLPLRVTKDNNIPWDAKEIESMKKRLLGRSVLQPVDFEAKVDSVATATMTCALIVDSVNKARGIYDELKSKGYIK